MNIVLWILGAILVIANFVVSFRLFQSTSYSTNQKLGQTVIIWLIPVLGASLIWNFLHDERTLRHTTDLADRIGHGDGSGPYQKMESESFGGDSGGVDGGGD